MQRQFVCKTIIDNPKHTGMKKITLIVFTICSLAVFQNCNNSKKIAKTPTVLSYNKDIMPIMQASCTPCHFPPEGRKQALNTYADVKANIAEIINRVKLPKSDTKFMPWKNKKPPLSDSLVNILVEWQKQNMSQ
jgi:hypothetical protein